MKGKLLIFESHPVQYRAPVYRALQSLCRDQFLVVYGTSHSLQGWIDTGFGQTTAWDEPLLEGYPHHLLGHAVPDGLQGFSSLSGKGVGTILNKERPPAVLLTQFRYKFDWAAFWSARRAGIPIWIRQETQDEAFVRSFSKGLIRSFFYRLLYTQVEHAFFIGTYNREHLLRHGIPSRRMSRAPYVTIDRYQGLSPTELTARRERCRKRLGIPSGAMVIAFSGKFISKKDPALVLSAVGSLVGRVNNPVSVLMMGSGEQETCLRGQAELLRSRGIQVIFAGFVNQSVIGDHYLAADILVLPSQRMGETWGLVVNEALLAGCSVVMSDAVGCVPEFSGWERVRVISVGSVTDCATALYELSTFERSFHWCRERMIEYSIERAAEAIADRMKLLT